MCVQLYAALLLVWPLPDPQLERPYEPPPAQWAAGHRGVDLAGEPGQPVRAVAPGRVSFAGTVAGRGVLSIELSGTGTPPLRTTYEPVSPSVSAGDRVRAGQSVGTLQATPSHCDPASCLHWGLRRGATYLDPLALIRKGPSVLLPVFDVPLPREGGGEERAGAASEPTASEPTAGAAVSGPTASGLVAALVLAAAALWARRRLHPR